MTGPMFTDVVLPDRLIRPQAFAMCTGTHRLGACLLAGSLGEVPVACDVAVLIEPEIVATP